MLDIELASYLTIILWNTVENQLQFIQVASDRCLIDEQACVVQANVLLPFARLRHCPKRYVAKRSLEHSCSTLNQVPNGIALGGGASLQGRRGRALCTCRHNHASQADNLSYKTKGCIVCRLTKYY